MNFANKISTFRILSVPFFIACLIYYTPQREFFRGLALLIFSLAVISDGVDGYIARKNKQVSQAGQILDPLGDKLLLMSAYIMLSFDKFVLSFPLWVSLVVISRDAIILGGTVIIYMVKHHINILPTRWGKLTTTFQMAAAFSVLSQLKISGVLWWLAAGFTLISGTDYVMRGFKTLYVVDNSANSPNNH